MALNLGCRASAIGSQPRPFDRRGARCGPGRSPTAQRPRPWGIPSVSSSACGSKYEDGALVGWCFSGIGGGFRRAWRHDRKSEENAVSSRWQVVNCRTRQNDGMVYRSGLRGLLRPKFHCSRKKRFQRYPVTTDEELPLRFEGVAECFETGTCGRSAPALYLERCQHSPGAHDKVNFHSPFAPIKNFAIPGSCGVDQACANRGLHQVAQYSRSALASLNV